MKKLNEWFQRELKKLDNVKICLCHEMTADMIKAAGPDAVIVATGSVTAVPPIKGIDSSITALDAINHPEKLGENIIIAGGGLIGCEIAYDEVQKGKKVTVIEALDDIMAAGAAAPLPNIMMIKAEFAARGVTVLTKTRVEEIREDGVTVKAEDGSTCEIKGDTIVNALGFRPVNKLAAELEGCGAAVCTIGDANAPANILQAVADGYAAANSI